MSRVRSTQPILPVLLQPITSDLDSKKAAQQDDASLSGMITALTSGQPIPPDVALGLKHAFMKEGVLCRMYQTSSSSARHTQIIIPGILKIIVLNQLHNQSGHLGVQKPLGKVKERYYWPGYEADVAVWIQECRQCQKKKPPHQSQQAPLDIITSNYPFEKLSWDIMGPLPLSYTGNRYIVMITDLFSKWVEAFPVKATDTETMVTLMVNEKVWCTSLHT